MFELFHALGIRFLQKYVCITICPLDMPFFPGSLNVREINVRPCSGA